jgi:hypothetical protein
VIVRIMGEGQRDVPVTELDTLNVLDAEVEAAVSADDEAAFARALGRLLDRVRELGQPLADDVLLPSELVLPGPDATADDVRHLFDGSGHGSGEGLVPG